MSMVERLGSHCAASTSAGAHCSWPCLRRRREGLAPRANTAPSCSLVLCRHAVEARRTAPARRSSVRPCGARTDNAGSRPLDEAESSVHAAAPLAAEPAASAAIGAGMDVPAFLAAGLALALAGALAAAAPAGAAESGVAYEPGAGGGLLKSLAGAAYLALVAVFVLRLLSKRANSSLTQAGGLAYGMWLVSTGVDAYFDRQAMPNQYTVRNITVTIRTVTQGLAYLATFIFGANAVGLTALAVQLVINPEAVDDGEAGDKATTEAAGEDARSR